MKTIISIDGMNCGHCTATVDKALRTVPGVSEVNVLLAEKRAEVTHEGGDLALMKKVVADAGFIVAGIA